MKSQNRDEGIRITQGSGKAEGADVVRADVIRVMLEQNPAYNRRALLGNLQMPAKMLSTF